MNFKNMGSDGKGGFPPDSCYLPQQQQQQQQQQRQPSGLPRLPSVYSLTLDEFQNAVGGLGKDFGSMNMDELLKSIWNAEETQAMALGDGMGMPEAGGSGLQRQGSLTLPRTISQKTVDEVWRDLFQESSAVTAAGQWAGGHGGGNLQPQQQRETTLAEMTLEEFLVRAGVVREETNLPPKPVVAGANNNSSGNNTNTTGSMYFGDLSTKNTNTSMGLALDLSQINGGAAASQSTASVTNAGISEFRPSYPPSVQVQLRNNNTGFVGQQGTNGGGIVGTSPVVNGGIIPGAVGLGASGVSVAATRSPVSPLPTDGRGNNNDGLSSLSPTPYMFNLGLGKKRGGVEKVVERRQRRMIKNRESAARSRARKQAYTMELEAEVAKLKEQNQELQNKQAQIMELQKNQVLEIINRQHGPKRQCLRRAQTGPW